MSLKNPVTPPEIDPGTVRFVAQRLNHYATPGPLFTVIINETQDRPLYTIASSVLLLVPSTLSQIAGSLYPAVSICCYEKVGKSTVP